MKKLLLSVMFIFCFAAASSAQSSKENWKNLQVEGSDKVFVNLTGTEVYKRDEVYFWMRYEHKTPITIETIPGKIFTTKTYYLVSRKLKKYSIIEIIYYDAEGNVLKSFSYRRSTENEAYKYNYPIIKDSEIDLALKAIKN